MSRAEAGNPSTSRTLKLSDQEGNSTTGPIKTIAKETRGYPNIEEQRRAMRWPEQEANSDVEITSGNRQRTKN